MKKFIVRKVNVSELIDLLIEAEQDKVKYIDLKCTLDTDEDAVELIENTQRGDTRITLNEDLIDNKGLLTDEALQRLFTNKN